MSAPPLPLGEARLLALRVLFGARNGLLYGVKVRAPHAAVLTALWAPGSAREKAVAVVLATARHGAALAAYATLYKAAFNALALAQAAASPRAGAVLRRRMPGASGVGEPGAPLRAALAGALAGGIVFRRPTSVHQQIVLFLYSRASASRPLLRKRARAPTPHADTYALPRAMRVHALRHRVSLRMSSAF